MQESIAEVLIAKVQDRMSTLRIGAPLDKAIVIGAIVAKVQLDPIRNLVDASCGFGGYRESGYGREGGREGLLEYLEPAWFKSAPTLPAEKTLAPPQLESADDSDTAAGTPDSDVPEIDRTVKLYIGGKQARPDSGYYTEVRAADGRLLGEAPLGNRKD